MANTQPVIALSIERPRHLGDIMKWAELADGLAIPSSAPVELSIGGSCLTVRAYIGQTFVPDLSSGDA